MRFQRFSDELYESLQAEALQGVSIRLKALQCVPKALRGPSESFTRSQVSFMVVSEELQGSGVEWLY